MFCSATGGAGGDGVLGIDVRPRLQGEGKDAGEGVAAGGGVPIVEGSVCGTWTEAGATPVGWVSLRVFWLPSGVLNNPRGPKGLSVSVAGKPGTKGPLSAGRCRRAPPGKKLDPWCDMCLHEKKIEHVDMCFMP